MVLMKRCKGFTLTELIVVLVVAVMLGGVLVPTLTHAKGVSRGASCKAHMRQIYNALSMYSQDYDGLIPGTYPHGLVWDSGGPGNGANYVWPSWAALLVTHPDEAWYLDPDYDYDPRETPWGPPVDYLDSAESLQCPKDPADPTLYPQNVHGSYGINNHMTYSPLNPNGRFYDLSATKVPDQMYLVFCNLNDGGGSYHEQNHAIVKNYIDFQANPLRAWTPALRHGYGKSTQVLYHDGNVERLNWKEIRTYNGALLSVGDDVIVRGPWLNGEEMTGFHDLPTSALETIMGLPGHEPIERPK